MTHLNLSTNREPSTVLKTDVGRRPSTVTDNGKRITEVLKPLNFLTLKP